MVSDFSNVTLLLVYYKEIASKLWKKSILTQNLNLVKLLIKCKGRIKTFFKNARWALFLGKYEGNCFKKMRSKHRETPDSRNREANTEQRKGKCQDESYYLNLESNLARLDEVTIGR